MELFIFARFHAVAGNESAVAEALCDVLGPSREEAGCLSVHAFRFDPGSATLLHSLALDKRGGVRESRQVAAYRTIHRARGVTDRAPSRCNASGAH